MDDLQVVAYSLFHSSNPLGYCQFFLRSQIYNLQLLIYSYSCMLYSYKNFFCFLLQIFSHSMIDFSIHLSNQHLFSLVDNYFFEYANYLEPQFSLIDNLSYPLDSWISNALFQILIVFASLYQLSQHFDLDHTYFLQIYQIFLPIEYHMLLLLRLQKNLKFYAVLLQHVLDDNSQERYFLKMNFCRLFEHCGSFLKVFVGLLIFLYLTKLYFAFEVLFLAQQQDSEVLHMIENLNTRQFCQSCKLYFITKKINFPNNFNLLSMLNRININDLRFMKFSKFQTNFLLFSCFTFSKQTYQFHPKYFNRKMDVNLPDKGVFKGIGPLERFVANNKKYFPNQRNIHQIVYTHGHNNDYSTVHKKFDLGRSFSKPEAVEIIKKNTNQSHFTLGFNETDRAKLRKPLEPTYLSLAKSQFQKYDKLNPPSQIRQTEEGLGFGDRLDVVENQLKPKKQRGKKLFNRAQQPNSATNMRRSAIELIAEMNKTNNYQTTTMTNFSNPSKIKMDNPHYQFGRSRRFNPITGQQMGKNTTFGYEDFNENTKKNYKANNFSRIERGGKGILRQDIISGRMINY